MRTVYFNGEFVAADEAKVSVFDRSFLYGDGLFETLLVHNGKVFRWSPHWERLAQAAVYLRIALRLPTDAAKECAVELMKQNGLRDGILRIHLSRGTGFRGYSTKGAEDPVLIMSLHDLPPSRAVPWRLKTSELRVLKNDPLARIKSSNKLIQILARNEAEQGGFDEALILNSADEIAEATSGNFFWVEQGKVYTPPLDAGILPGITRSVLIELCSALGIPIAEQAGKISDLRRAEAAFLSLSSLGIVEVGALDELNFAGSEIVSKLLQSYRELVALETK